MWRRCPRHVKQILDPVDARHVLNRALDLVDERSALYFSAEEDDSPLGVDANGAFRDVPVAEEDALDLVGESCVIELGGRCVTEPVGEPTRMPADVCCPDT